MPVDDSRHRGADGLCALLGPALGTYPLGQSLKSGREEEGTEGTSPHYWVMKIKGIRVPVTLVEVVQTGPVALPQLA